MLSKTLKVLFIGLALLISNSFFAQSQENVEKQQNPDRNEFIQKELNLNNDQIQSFNAYFDEYTEALKKLRMDRSLEPTTKSEKMSAAKKDYYKNLKSILSKKQFSKYLTAYDGSSKSTNRNRKVE